MFKLFSEWQRLDLIISQELADAYIVSFEVVIDVPDRMQLPYQVTELYTDLMGSLV